MRQLDQDGVPRTLKEPKFFRRSSLNYGVFCFTEKNDDFLIWSHYARAHKGICVAFDLRRSFKNLGKRPQRFLTSDGSKPYLEVVEYGLDRKRTLDYYGHMLLSGNEVMKALANKPKYWKHEFETRLILSGSRNRKVKIPSSCVSELIFGCQTSKRDRLATQEILDKRKNTVRPFEEAIRIIEEKIIP